MGTVVVLARDKQFVGVCVKAKEAWEVVAHHCDLTKYRLIDPRKTEPDNDIEPTYENLCRVLRLDTRAALYRLSDGRAEWAFFFTELGGCTVPESSDTALPPTPAPPVSGSGMGCILV